MAMGRINMNVDSVAMNDVLKRLDLADNLGRTAPRALRAGAEIVLRQAIANASGSSPRPRTGELKDSLKIGRRKKTMDRHAVEVGTFYPDAPHAHLVEQGHGGPKPAPAHPFLEPAIEETEQAVYDAIMKELMSGL